MITIKLSFKQHSRCGATYEGHPVSYRSGLIRLHVCLAENLICLQALLPKYPLLTRSLSSKLIMIWYVIKQLLQKGFTWLAKRYVWRKVCKIFVWCIGETTSVWLSVNVICWKFFTEILHIYKNYPMRMRINYFAWKCLIGWTFRICDVSSFNFRVLFEALF